jgi:hypothetical protein
MTLLSSLLLLFIIFIFPKISSFHQEKGEGGSSIPTGDFILSNTNNNNYNSLHGALFESDGTDDDDTNIHQYNNEYEYNDE